MNLGRAALAVGAISAMVLPSVSAAEAEVPRVEKGRPSAPIGLWIAGDTHVHDDHSSDGSVLRQTVGQGSPGNVSVKDQIRQAERNGLGFLPLTDHRTYDQHWDPLWTSDKLVLIPGEEANGSPHSTPLGLADEIVDGANPPNSHGYRHLQQSIWDIHAQNASWGIAHPDDGEWEDDKPTINANAIGVDTVEVWNRDSDPEEEIDYAENRWNRGFRFGVVGGSDNHFKELWPVAGPGQPTTWVFAPEATERGIVAGLKAGRTSVSSGPLGPRVTLTADMDGDGVYEAIAGDEVTAVPGAKATLKIRVERGSTSNVVVYAAPGRSAKPLATFRPLLGDKTFVLPIAANKAWYRVEVRGLGGPSALRNKYAPHDTLLAVSSPLFVDQGTRAVARQENPMPAVTAGADGATAALETAGVFTGWGDVADSFTVAERDVAGRARVVFRNKAGTVTTISDPANNARFPVVAASGSQVWVAWQDERSPQTPHRTNIVERHSADGGETWSAIYPVTTDGKSQRPAMEMTPSRVPVVAWQSNAGGAFDIWARVLGTDNAAVNISAPGKTTVKGNALDTRSAVYPASVFPSIAVERFTGRVAIGWQDNRFDIDPGWTGSTKGEGTAVDDWEILVVTREPDTKKWTLPENASRDKLHADRHPSLTFGNGALIAAWDRKTLDESGANLEVRYATHYASRASAWSASMPVAPDATAMSQRPQLTTDYSGRPVIVWVDNRSADWRWGLWSATLLSNPTTPAGPPVRLTNNGNATYPRVDGPNLVFTSDRGATRLQRDPTHGVYRTLVPDAQRVLPPG